MELRRWENRIGRVTAIIPGRVTLDRIASQLVHVTGITDLMARLMALDVMAKEKSIFPDRFVLGRSGMTPQIVGGEWMDGRTGKMNVVLDAESVGSVPFSSDPTSTQAIDRLERNARISSGLVPQMGGETYGALRTGRGIDALMGAAVDPRIQEMQEIMQAWLPYLNEIVFDTYTEYWPRKSYTLTSGWPVDAGVVEFTPAKHIETNANAVSYPIAGADVQSTNIILGQLLGSEAISRQTFRERHPWIGDAAEESARVDEETFERAATQAVLQQAMAGQLPLMFLAEIEKARRGSPDGGHLRCHRDRQTEDRARCKQAPPRPSRDRIRRWPPSRPPGSPWPGNPPRSAAVGPSGAPEGSSIGPTQDMNGLRQLMNALAQTSRSA